VREATVFIANLTDSDVNRSINGIEGITSTGFSSGTTAASFEARSNTTSDCSGGVLFRSGFEKP
jgi:hypothetical protein